MNLHHSVIWAYVKNKKNILFWESHKNVIEKQPINNKKNYEAVYKLNKILNNHKIKYESFSDSILKKNVSFLTDCDTIIHNFDLKKIYNLISIDDDNFAALIPCKRVTDELIFYGLWIKNNCYTKIKNVIYFTFNDSTIKFIHLDRFLNETKLSEYQNMISFLNYIVTSSKEECYMNALKTFNAKDFENKYYDDIFKECINKNLINESFCDSYVKINSNSCHFKTYRRIVFEKNVFDTNVMFINKEIEKDLTIIEIIFNDDENILFGFKNESENEIYTTFSFEIFYNKLIDKKLICFDFQTKYLLIKECLKYSFVNIFNDIFILKEFLKNSGFRHKNLFDYSFYQLSRCLIIKQYTNNLIQWNNIDFYEINQILNSTIPSLFLKKIETYLIHKMKVFQEIYTILMNLFNGNYMCVIKTKKNTFYHSNFMDYELTDNIRCVKYTHSCEGCIMGLENQQGHSCLS